MALMTINPALKRAISSPQINDTPLKPPAFTSPRSQIEQHQNKSSSDHQTNLSAPNRPEGRPRQEQAKEEKGQGRTTAYDPRFHAWLARSLGEWVVADSGAGLIDADRSQIERKMGRRKGTALRDFLCLPKVRLRPPAGSPRPRLPSRGVRGEERVQVLRRLLPPPLTSPPPSRNTTR